MVFLRYLLTSSIRGPETKFRYLSPKEHECTLVFKYTYWLADFHESFSVRSSDISVSDPVNTKDITLGELSLQIGSVHLLPSGAFHISKSSLKHNFNYSPKISSF
ncbi:MAG: hypothetical protein BWX96_01632 [Bacteroidetes bacterium ADurb.Bin145]|jgi:hypothetical protein|nr:MAG: hypothetical protein BWX96_01632 [Bacteroidetes bacterium ADurb.Bin145]